MFLQRHVVGAGSSYPLMPSTTTNGKEFAPMIEQNASAAKFLGAMRPSAGRSTAARRSTFVMDARSPKWRRPSPAPNSSRMNQTVSGSSASSVAGAKLTTSNVANARPLLPCTAGSGRTWPRCPRHGSPVRHAKMKHSRKLRDPGNTQNGSNAVAVARCSQPHPSPAGKMTSNSNAA